jgi:putative membrane protein
MRFLIRLALNAGIVWITFAVIDGLTFGGDWLGFLLIVGMLALANAIVLPILKLLALPIRMMTLGLATLAINVAVIVAIIWFAGQLDPDVASAAWGPTILGALMITILSSIVSTLIKD